MKDMKNKDMFVNNKDHRIRLRTSEIYMWQPKVHGLGLKEKTFYYNLKLRRCLIKKKTMKKGFRLYMFLIQLNRK